MATVRRSDLQDALDHAGEQGDALEQLRLEDFIVSPVGTLRLQDAYRFDDIGAWAEWAKGELAAESPADRRRAVASFRGKDWAARALAWTPQTMPPIVIVERRDGATVIGDGRGRVSYAIGMGWPALPAVLLKERERRAGRVAGRAAGQKIVVMNPVTSESSDPARRRRYPRAPVDDFSVALWAFAELALAHNGMQVAEIVYVPEHHEAAVKFFRTDRNLQLDQKKRLGAAVDWLWDNPPKIYDVKANGDLARVVDGRTYFAVDAPHKIVGNILTWKFSKEALAPPKIPRGPRRRS